MDALTAVKKIMSKKVLCVESEFCEICRENVGVTNSRFLYDDDGGGLWVCVRCEEKAETDYECPCGCGGESDCCCYADGAAGGEQS